MKNNTESKKAAAPKASKAKREAAAIAPTATAEAQKPAKKSKEESEPVGRARFFQRVGELMAAK